MKRVVIIGGGIAGLSAAYYLQKSPQIEVTLLEGSDRLGGKIGTDRDGSFLIEQGPDSVFTAKPAAVELATELGMESEFVEPLQHDFSILTNGKLFHVPRALASLMPNAASALEKAEFFGAATRRRILREKDAPKGDGRDESIASFFRRRFGRKFSNMLAEPLLAGIHGGDPEKLSMKALYPTYLGLEQKKGSLTAPSDHPAPNPSATGRKAGFLSLRDGMESLVDRICDNLSRVRILKGSEANGIVREGSSYVVHVEDLPPIPADEIVLAVPAYVASCLLREVSKTASEELLRIRHASTAVVTLGYRRSSFDKDPHGNGFLVPYTEKSDITGCTWTSNKWPGRSPEDTLLIRCFMGRDGGMNVDEFSDDDLQKKAADELRSILRPHDAPTYASVRRWTRAMPQKVVGHSELLESIEANLEGMPFFLIGASYRSSGIPDCVRDGKDVAERIIQELA